MKTKSYEKICMLLVLNANLNRIKNSYNSKMNRIVLLENFCKKIGIFTTNAKLSPATQQTQTKSSIIQNQKVTYGPYGQLLLEQIKNEWIRANLSKFKSNFLINDLNVLKEIHAEKKDIDFDFFFDNLSAFFNIEKLPIGLVNVFKCLNDDMPSEFEYKMKTNESLNFLTKYNSDAFINLNCLHFCENNSIGNQIKESFVDPLTFWQRERKNWWGKFLRSPENLTFITEKEKGIEQTNICYEVDVSILNENEKKDPSFRWLENIRHFDSSQSDQLRSVLKPFLHNKLLSSTKQVILTQTNCQNVLENVLFDSVEFPLVDPHENLINKYSSKTVFNLDYRLAPYKAALLFESKGTNSGISLIANDLKKQFYSHNINVMLISSLNESDLNEKYALLDEMGIPYAVYLPLTITNNGLCSIRNRDTSLFEETHISLVVKHFSLISNALQF